MLFRSLTNVILSLAYFVFFWTGGRRATPGQRMFELQVGNAVDGSGLTLSQAVKRWLLLGNVLFLLDVVPMLSRVTSPLWFGWAIVLLVTVARSPTKQGFHDRLANTAVVRPLSARSSGLAKALVAAFGILIVGSLVAIVALVFLGSQVSTLLSARPATEPAASATGVADGSDRQVEVSLLQAGDCFDVVAGPAEGAYLAAPRSCDQPHALEQISLITIPAGSGDPYPGDGAISGLVEPKCATDFAAYVGRSGPDSIYNYAYLVMPKSSWDAGERRVPCGAGSDDPAEQITGSVRNAGR